MKRKKETYVKMRREGSVTALESYKLARKDLKKVKKSQEGT